ncbi:MAG: PHP domain-containing protein [Oscillospiraceae bacterium]|nr:PHP domain-containing protein [Oscillospiraceae bacterium]
MIIEMHAHTKEVSPCARVAAKDMITACKEYGYSAVVITDHFNDYILESFSGNSRQRVTRYLEGYMIAKDYADEIGIRVLFGVEVNIGRGREDFLIYGVTPDFLYDYPKLYTFTQRQMYEAAHSAGALVYQAHPCRYPCRPMDPNFMDGVEVCNGNFLHGGPAFGTENSNRDALEWAKKHSHLLHVAGSDVHNLIDVGSAGINIPDEEAPQKEEDLLRVLKSKRMQLHVIEELWSVYNE